MIETGLVYIYSDFIGCGALIEGGYIATCRHVWRDAIVSEREETGGSPEVEIEFPFAQEVDVACRAWLADVCGGLDARAPDLVLLKPDGIPGGVMSLQLAREPEFETGLGQCHCCLKTRDIDSFIDGEIRSRINLKGMRQFTGSNGQSHWMEEGSSGSPVFLKEKAQQLAGIIALAEVGSSKGETRQCEAFIVPATTIHKHLRALLEQLAADELAEKRGIDPAKLQPILAKLGVMDVPDDKIAERLDASVEDILAQAAKPVPASNDGADIEAAIKSSRAKLGALDPAGALEVLQAKIAGEEQERARRLVPLLKERAAVERLAFDYDAAKQSLTEVARLASDDVWAFIDLGDLYVITGPLEEAAKAFRNAEAAARRQGDERGRGAACDRLGNVLLAKGDSEGALDAFRTALEIAEAHARRHPGNSDWQRHLSVSFENIGDVQMAQGDLEGALKSYSDSLAIRDRLAKSDPANADWQRNLSVSYDRVGDVQMVQGDLAGALKSYQDSLAIGDRLAKTDPDNAGLQHDLAVSYNKIGDVQVAQGDLAGALKSYSDLLAITDLLAKSDPRNAGWQRDLSMSYSRVGNVQVAQGDLAGALKSYSDGLAVIDQLAKSDPGNAGWQRDLSVSHNKIGDLQKAQGDLAGALKSYQDDLAIADPLAKSDPGNAGWQRDLSVSYDRIGDVQMSQGDLAGALKSYQDSLAIFERLVKSDPSNAGWQRDLAVAFAKLGSVHRASGDSAKALDFLRQGQAIMVRMTMLSPDNATWKQDLAWFDGQIEDLTP